MYQKSNKRKLQAQATKMNIYNHATKLFRERGFANVTVEEIAEEAGISIGTFYHHFKSKQETLALYHEKLDYLYQEYYEHSLTLPTGDNDLERLKEMILYIAETCVELGVDYVRVVYPYMITNQPFGEAMIDDVRPYFQIMYDLFRTGQEHGVIRDDIPPEQLVRDVTILLRGNIVDWCINGGAVSMKATCKSSLSIFLRGIRAM